MTEKYGALMSQILDDFFFVSPVHLEKCSSDLSTFISIFRDIGVSLKKETTVRPTTNIVIYGIEIDSVNKVSRLSEPKVPKERRFSLYGLGGLPSLLPINSPDIIAHIKGVSCLSDYMVIRATLGGAF